MTNGTVLVASPSAIGRPPDASGSSVPAWPARLATNSRLITDTAWVEVMPTGLSSTTQPCTSRFSRLSCPPPRGGAGASPVVVNSFILAGLLLEVAANLRCSQKLLDSFGFVESLVDSEANVRCKFQINVARNLAAQEAFVALERRQHLGAVAPAKRHYVDGREPQIGAHAHLGHG